VAGQAVHRRPGAARADRHMRGEVRTASLRRVGRPPGGGEAPAAGARGARGGRATRLRGSRGRPGRHTRASRPSVRPRVAVSPQAASSPWRS